MDDPKKPESFEEEAEAFQEDPAPPSPEGEVEEAAKEGEENPWREKYIRLLADFDNYRKRVAREQEESRKFANESLLKAFCQFWTIWSGPFFISEKVSSPSPELKALADGVKLTEKQFLELLEKNHVTRVPAQGSVFDPNVHEAMGFSPSEGFEEGAIVDVYQQGYMMQGRLLRPALVTVAQKKKNNPEADIPDAVFLLCPGKPRPGNEIRTDLN